MSMKTVSRTQKKEVTVAAPPAKAHTLRALFLSALADGRSVIRDPLLGDDQQRAIDSLQRLGVNIVVQGASVIVDGVGGKLQPAQEELYVGESGVSMNFLTALTCLSPKPITITGAPRITERPISEIVNGLRRLGCRIEYMAKDGFPPIKVYGGGIPGGRTEIRGDISSQYFSAILASAPYAENPVELGCIGVMTEKPYLEITMQMMGDFGVVVERRDFAEFRVPNTCGYKAREMRIEGDYSSASFFFEAAAVCGNSVTVTGLNPASAQGDKRFLALIREMGCEVSASESAVIVRGGGLKGIEADMSDTPDLVPPLAVTAAFAQGRTRLTNIAHLRHKECDRLAVTVSELRAMGARASCDEDSITIEGGAELHGARIDPHNDHRIAMAFAVAGLAVGDQTIEDEACVAKSFPDFWERLKAFE
jgi:3-phosphoshikimate 1-carboxyvinyltransferase